MASSSILLTLTITTLLFLHPSTLSGEEEKKKPDLKAMIEVFKKKLEENKRIKRMTLSTTTNDPLQNLHSMTLFAPTDNAFPVGLSMEKQEEVLLHHVLPKHYTMHDLATLSGPVPTLANGTGSSLYITHAANQLIVSNGVVMTPIRYALTEEFPLAVYVIDQVLWPSEFS